LRTTTICSGLTTPQIFFDGPFSHQVCVSFAFPILSSHIFYAYLTFARVHSESNKLNLNFISIFLTGWLKEWHCGVRATKTNKLVGFISAIPASIRIYNKTHELVEINFLCVHKKLRSKRLAPVLIREITRRVNCKGIFQAVYTAGVVLPKPVGTCRYIVTLNHYEN
jgi:hypothetical protein